MTRSILVTAGVRHTRLHVVADCLCAAREPEIGRTMPATMPGIACRRLYCVKKRTAAIATDNATALTVPVSRSTPMR